MILTVVWFILGIVAAHLVYGRLQGDKKKLGYVLIIAALIYIGFAIVGGEFSNWLLVELIGVVAYTIPAVLGIRGSAWWLAIGWALHPVWDIVIHFVIPLNHAHFVPMWYAVACLSFDLLFAAYIARDLLKKSERALAR